MRRKQHQFNLSICYFIILTIAISTALLLFIFLSYYSPSFPLSWRAETLQIIRWSSKLEDDSSHNDRRIFFHQTNTRSANQFNQRQTCAVESAAKHNPDRPIQVFIQAEAVDSKAPFLSILGHYQNVTIILIDKVEDYFRNSPLEKIYKTAPWNTSLFGATHYSDYIRALSLYKGIYIVDIKIEYKYGSIHLFV